MSARRINRNRQFQTRWKHNWPSALQYVRSTKPAYDVVPSLHDQVKNRCHDYAKRTGHMPEVETIYKVYLYELDGLKEGAYQHFLGKKARARRRARRARGEKTGLGRVFQKIGVSAKLAILLPFKGMMIKALNRQGIAASKKDKMKELVTKFLKHIVRKEAPQFYPESAVNKLEVTPEDAEHAAIGAIIGTIIDAVKRFVQFLKDKKKSGEPLTSSQEDILVTADNAARQFEDYKREQVRHEIGGFVDKIAH